MPTPQRRLVVLLFAALFVAACSGDDEATEDPVYLGAPLCNTLVTEQAPNEVFTSRLLPTEAILDAYPFGGTQPDNVQEVINFELGFYVINAPAYANVPLTAPADLYVKTLERSRYDDDQNGTIDREDFGITYEVCSHRVDGKQTQAIAGNFAHVKSLSADLMAILDAEEQRLESGQVSADASPLRCNLGGAAGQGTCTLFVSIIQEQDDDYRLVISEGTQFGTTASPGIDANLLDYRNANYFINPDRWTADTGHAVGFKYGACTYEYFAEPFRTQYLRKIGANGVFRNVDELGTPVQVEHPCGLLAADIHGNESAAGYWMRASSANLAIEEDMSIQQVEQVLGGLLVLSENFLRPNTHSSISTNIIELSGGGEPEFPMLVEIENDTPPDTFTNAPFRNVTPGHVYCYEGQGYLNFDNFYFLLELTSTPSAKITIERVNNPCSAQPQVARTFSANKIEFVR